MKTLLSMVSLAVVSTLVACGSSGGTSTSSSTVSAISITPDPCAVTRTNSVQMKAVATATDGTKSDITDASGIKWSSSNTGTLTVSSAGVVVGVNPGVTGVNVAYSGATGSVDCTVAP